jgi:hypothetical protein
VQGGHARCGRSCSAAAAGGFAREQRGRTWRTSQAVEEKAAEGTALMQADHGPHGGGGAVMARRAGRRSGEAKVATGCNELEGARCSQAWRAPFIHAEVEAGATRRGFDAQRKTGGGGRLARMASQQAERAAELLQAGVAHRRCNQAPRSCRRLRGCAVTVHVFVN